MNVLIINLDKGIFSKNSASLERLKEYSNLVDKIFVVVWTKKKEKEINHNNKLFVYPTNSFFRFFYFLNTFFIFKKIYKKNKLDLIFTQDTFETGFLGMVLSKIFKIPIQLQIHTDFLSPYFKKESLLNCVRVKIAKFLIPKADCVRVVSNRIKESLLQVISYKLPVTVLPIFVDAKKIQDAEIKTNLHKKYPQFDFIILMASRFSKEKNIELAISAMSDIGEKYPKTGLVIVGEGSMKKNYESRIKNYENIKIESWTNDLSSYYKTCDLFLLTSNYEGYGLTLVEASLAGAKIISSDVGIASEILDKENIFEVGNKKDLMSKLKKAIKGDIKLTPPGGANLQTKEEYLQALKNSWEKCAY